MKKAAVQQKAALSTTKVAARNRERRRSKAEPKAGLQRIVLFNSTGKPQAEDLLDALSAPRREKKESGGKVKEEGGALLAAMILEHKQGEDEWPSFKAKCSRRGWHMVGAAAAAGPNGGASGGAAVAASTPLGAVAGRHDLPGASSPGRVAVAWVQGRGFPALLLIAAYFVTTEPLHSKANLAILRDISEVILRTGALWLLAADFQNEPESLAETGWLKAMGGRVVATSAATSATGSVLDFFAVDCRLVGAFVDVCAWPWAARTHRPVELRLKLALASRKVRKLEYPRAFPRKRPVGPPRGEVSSKPWATPDAQNMTVEEIEGAINERYGELVGCMEKQLCDLCDCYKDGAPDPAYMGRSEAPKERWRQVTPPSVGEFAGLPKEGRKMALLFEKTAGNRSHDQKQAAEKKLGRRSGWQPNGGQRVAAQKGAKPRNRRDRTGHCRSRC